MIIATTVVLGATKVWWYVARSAGIVAWGLSALAVLWGLALATRALGRKPPAPWLLDVHRFLGALTVVFVVVHLVGLAFDPWASFGLDELLDPHGVVVEAGRGGLGDRGLLPAARHRGHLAHQGRGCP